MQIGLIYYLMQLHSHILVKTFQSISLNIHWPYENTAIVSNGMKVKQIMKSQ